MCSILASEPSSPAPSAARRKRFLYLLSFLLFGLGGFLVLGVTELLLRAHYQSQASEARDHVYATSYLPILVKPNYQGEMWGIPYRTNRYGFRDEEDFPSQPPPGEYRILSLGDSIGFGVGIPSRAHYSKVLERALNRSSLQRRFRVINAAGPGYSPSAYAVYLRHLGLDLHPDLVLVEIELCNDVTDEALLGWETRAPEEDLPWAVRGGRYLVAWDGTLLAGQTLGPYWFERTYTYTILTRRLLNLLFRLRPTQPFASTPGVTYYSLGFDRFLLDTERLEAGWQRLFASLAAIHRLLSREKVLLLVMIMPSRYVFQEQAPRHRQFARQLLDRARELAQQHELPWLDLAPALERAGGAELYFDFAHLREEGNRTVGEALFQHLAPQLLQP